MSYELGLRLDGRRPVLRAPRVRQLRQLAVLGRLIRLALSRSGLSHSVDMTELRRLDPQAAELLAASAERAALVVSQPVGHVAIFFDVTEPERTSFLVLRGRTARIARASDCPLDPAGHLPATRLLAVRRDEQMIFGGNGGCDVDEEEAGIRPAALHDRVLATVLFTDIVGSTERAAQLGDRAWRELLDTHDGLVRRQLDCFRGKEVKTVGDGFVATFDVPGRALQCACAIRDAVTALEIKVRTGLHTGEIEVRGDDVAGIAVHLAQRVSALADPGEVLVSRTVADLVTGSGMRFEDRGEHQLRGVPGVWNLYSLVT